MEKYEIKECKIKEIDRLVKSVVDILEKYGRYVIVSGYVSIFCCRTRPTQDIDIIFIPYSEKHVKELIKDLKNRGYEIYFDEVSFFKYKEAFYIYTNFDLGGYNIYFEIKQPKNEFQKIAVTNRIILKKEDIEMYFSPIELQIVYKLWLGSDKDFLDAKYLYELFKKYLNISELERLSKLFGVENELEKIKS